MSGAQSPEVFSYESTAYHLPEDTLHLNPQTAYLAANSLFKFRRSYSATFVMAPASRDGLPSAAPGLGGAAFNSTENIQLGDGVNGNMNGVDGRYSAQALQSVPEPDSIAIIGMACQFPQDAENVEKFWQLMMEGKSAMTEFPPGKFNIDAHYHPDHTRNSSVSL